MAGAFPCSCSPDKPWRIPTRGPRLQVWRHIEAAEAEAVYREELERNPGNGWSLHGLALSLRAQGKADAAAEAERQQREAWQHADVKLVASRF